MKLKAHFPLLCCLLAMLNLPAQASDGPPALPDINGNGADAAARQRTNRVLDDAGNAARHGLVRPFPDIRTPVSGVDIGQIAARYGQAAKADSDERLMIFVTLGMPEKALLNLARQAARARAVLVFRGVEGGLSGGNRGKAMEAFKPLAEAGASIQIHPELFKAYKITQAPTFVLTAADAGGACMSDRIKACSNALRGSGDVSLDYVLERWASGTGELADEARARLAMIEARP